MIRARRLAALLTAASAWACTPTLDWREVRPEGSQARLMFPCKPASHARRVALAGAQVEMAMFACSAGGTTFALAFADMVDPALVTAALSELSQAASANLQAGSVPAPTPAAVPGMTPNPQAVQWQAQGRLPDGRAVHERVLFFAHGTRVFQATMLGAALEAESQDNFFGALRVGG